MTRCFVVPALVCLLASSLGSTAAHASDDNDEGEPSDSELRAQLADAEQEYQEAELTYENEVTGRIPWIQGGLAAGLTRASAHEMRGAVGGAVKLRFDLGVVVPYLDALVARGSGGWSGVRAGIVVGYRTSRPLARVIDSKRIPHLNLRIDTVRTYHARRTPAVYGVGIGGSSFWTRGVDVGSFEPSLAHVSGQHDVMFGPMFTTTGTVGWRGGIGYTWPARGHSVFLRLDASYLGGNEDLGLLGMVTVGGGSGLGVDFRGDAPQE